ncbi:MerR family transcriptional regulator [Bifidobacterium choloepi]|uniref:DNA-binding protein n=1 Tax=Bifidobacterium choloepi TaxID=2614131 RepID=A0A6I5N2U0_9BIFI|nr:hypothetical protein [Bifidobacterium choloepi]NEG70495.1 hypothetical protein [Bifidobacterium choloepi]
MTKQVTGFRMFRILTMDWRQLLEEEEIPSTKAGRHRRVKPDDLHEYANRRHRLNMELFASLAEDEDPLATADNPLIRKKEA